MKKKVMIPYLNIDEHYYIENDDIRLRINESEESLQGTWDDVWNDVLNIIEHFKASDEQHNPNSI